MKVNTEKMLDLIIMARPNASPDDVRKLAPILAPLPDAELKARVAKARRRKERREGKQ
ncbi:MAG: hypothetical protein R3E14_08145 [Erythrobacter sp.]|jgi:hypothetical protein|uniref:Uncharacterized protein n=2 Tax=Sphingopyxis macrogoltabida TaxID=33050 RepID=A0A0N7GTC7_SPHMC|nr:hypothetical protein AN936_23695 [Sphingopyxis macrogoltabida]